MRSRIGVSVLTIFLVFTMGGCAKESESASSSCQTQKKSHQGCCSHHGGFGNQCGEGEALYTGSGELICNDGTKSPSCTRGKPVLEMISEYERDIKIEESFLGREGEGFSQTDLENHPYGS